MASTASSVEPSAIHRSSSGSSVWSITSSRPPSQRRASITSEAYARPGSVPKRAHARGLSPSVRGRFTGMADLERRPGRRPTRREREKRAYQLVVLGGVPGLLGAVGLVLAMAGGIGAGLRIVLLIVAAVSYVLFRRMTAR